MRARGDSSPAHKVRCSSPICRSEVFMKKKSTSRRLPSADGEETRRMSGLPNAAPPDFWERFHALLERMATIELRHVWDYSVSLPPEVSSESETPKSPEASSGGSKRRSSPRRKGKPKKKSSR